MNILLLGEFSGLYHNLKLGLEACGHDVTLISTGDGFKNLPSDMCLNSGRNGLIGGFLNRIEEVFLIQSLKDYDIVQIVNPFLFGHRLPWTRYLFKILSRNNGKVFFSAAGDDAFYWQVAIKRLDYGPFSDFLKFDLRRPSYYLQHQRAFKFNRDILRFCSGVIPIAYDYQVGYLGHSKLCPLIPAGIDISNIELQKNNVRERLVIFHGLNRYGFKGTHLIEKAFLILRERYPEKVECIIAGRLPFSEYIKILANANVVIDQVSSHSLGLNGIIAMAMGKIVIGGYEPIAHDHIDTSDACVLNIKPNVDSIVKAVENVLENKHKISDWSKRSRAYAEKYHNHITSAKMYEDIWNNTLDVI